MLNFIRERAQGWVAWFIVGLISIPFALWGVNSYLTGAKDIVVAKVNGEAIQQTEYQRSLQQYRDNMRNRMGEDFDPSLFENIAVKQGVLNGLIEQKLLISAGQDIGQQVSDVTLSAFIESNPAFQRKGEFSADMYELSLARVNLDPIRYEAQLRTDLLNQEMTGNIQRSVIVTNHAIDDVLRLEKQTRDIAYGVIAAQDQLADIVVTDEAINDYYQANLANYQSPERVSVNYIELSIDELSKTITVDDDALRTYYSENENQFVGPEQRRASHILIEGDDDASLATIAIIQGRLAQGEDFAVLAKEYSQDTGSAAEGGDLGYFQRNVMDPAFEQAAFALQQDEISAPVKTEYGTHFIKVTDIKAADPQVFDVIREQVATAYQNQQAEDLFYEQAELLADLSYESPDNLDVVAEELGLIIKTTDMFTRHGGTGLVANKKVVKVAFSEDVLANDLNSAVIELNKSHLVVIHKKQYSVASQLPYDSVSPAITEQLRFTMASEQAGKKGEEIIMQLKVGDNAQTLLGEENWHAQQRYSRSEDNVSAQVLNQAFKVDKPSGNAQYTGFIANNGNYIIVKVAAVYDGEPNVATVEERDGLQSHLMRVYGISELQALLNGLKEQADIKIFEQYL